MHPDSEGCSQIFFSLRVTGYQSSFPPCLHTAIYKYARLHSLHVNRFALPHAKYRRGLWFFFSAQGRPQIPIFFCARTTPRARLPCCTLNRSLLISLLLSSTSRSLSYPSHRCYTSRRYPYFLLRKDDNQHFTGRQRFFKALGATLGT